MENNSTKTYSLPYAWGEAWLTLCRKDVPSGTTLTLQLESVPLEAAWLLILEFATRNSLTAAYTGTQITLTKK